MARQPKVAIYVRVSTDEQNPDAQLRDLREYVRSRGWQNITEYVDHGVSGAKDSRPKWNELWDAVQKGRVHVLLTHALDRLGRSLPHLVKILSTLSERNITLVSYRENIDLSTAQGRLIASIFAVLAEYELSMIRERTRAGMRSAKARGKKIGNQKRFFDKKKATQLRDRGWGQIRIARKLSIGVGRVNRWVQEEYLPAEKRARLNGAVRCTPPD